MQAVIELATNANNPISTNDWDTVSAMTYEALNAAIVAEKTSPASFSQDGSSGLIGSYTVASDFSDWQLVEGGDGQNVWLNLPLSNGSAVFKQLNESYSFEGNAVVEVKMEYLPQPPTEDGNPQNLQVKTTSSDSDTPVVSVETISLINPTDPSTPIDSTVVEIIEGALLEWLTANLQDFNQVFAVADLNVVLASDDPSLQWLKPTYVSYAVTDKGSLSSSVFGVLAMTRSNVTPPTSHQVSPDAIPEGCNGGFLLSQELFMNEIVLPGIYLMFPGSTPNDFVVNNDNSQVTNTVPLSFQLTDDDNNVYTANVNTQNFKITLLGQQLTVIFTDLNFETGWGVYTHLNFQGVYQMDMNAQSRQLEMYMVGTPTMYTYITLTSGRQWADIGISIVLSVAGAVVGAFLGGLVSAGITAITETAVDTTAEGLTDSITQAGLDGGTEAGTDVIIDGLEDGMLDSEEQIETDAAEAAPEMSDAADGGKKPMKGSGWLRRNGIKIFGSVVGAAAGAAVGSTPLILANMGKQADDYPTLDNFAEEVVSSVEWPNTSGYVMESAQLNGSLQIGFNFTT